MPDLERGGTARQLSVSNRACVAACVVEGAELARLAARPQQPTCCPAPPILQPRKGCFEVRRGGKVYVSLQVGNCL